MEGVSETDSTTSLLRRNTYHAHIPLYVLDVVRTYQDHPKYAKGLKECDIIEMLEKERFSSGDIESQVKSAIKELTTAGFIRCIHQGYRTLGPFARLAQARTPRQFNIAWEKITDLQKISSTSLVSTSTSHGYTC